MKFKYYLNHTWFKLILLSFVIAIFIANSANAYTLNSITVGNSSIFPCEATTITATFDTPVSSVSVIFVNQAIIENGIQVYNVTSQSMSTSDSITWTTSYGNNPSLKWGKKTISLYVNGADNINTGAKIFVYNAGYRVCSGSDQTSYRNYVQGIGRYTNLLATTNISLLEWAVYPWEEALGYVFYMFIMFSITTSIYFKTQNIIQPTFVAIFMLIVAGATSITVNVNLKSWILVLLATGFAVVYYRLMIKE